MRFTNTISFIVGNVEYKIPKDLIKKYPTSWLYRITNVNAPCNYAIELKDMPETEFRIVYDYICKNTEPMPDNVGMLNKFELGDEYNYTLIFNIEEYYRDNLYNSSKNEKLLDPLYGLIKMTENGQLHVDLAHRVSPTEIVSQLLFCRESPAKPVETPNIAPFEMFRGITNIMVAGGSVFGAIFNKKSPDTDIFLFGLNEEQAVAKIFELVEKIQEEYKNESCLKIEFLRNDNVLQIDVKYSDKKFRWIEKSYQIILRLYTSPSEILHSFDVDSCCLGIVDGEIYCTKRALFSFRFGYNTVNFARLSPSYPYRLAKYANRGVRVYVPDFDRKNVQEDEIENYFKNKLYRYTPNMIGKLQGLDILLFIEERSKRSKQTIKVCDRVSDYYMHKKNSGDWIESLFEYLTRSRKDYPEKSTKYMPHILAICNLLPAFKHFIKSEIDYSDFHENNSENIREAKFNIDQLIKFVNNMGLDVNISISNLDKERAIDAGDISRNFFSYNESRKNVKFSSNYTHYPNELDTEQKSRYHKALQSRTNNIKNARFEFYQNSDLNVAMKMPKNIYKVLEIVKTVVFPRRISFKTINPGEQATSTFNVQVLADNTEWYKGQFYKTEDTKSD